MAYTLYLTPGTNAKVLTDKIDVFEATTQRKFENCELSLTRYITSKNTSLDINLNIYILKQPRFFFIFFNVSSTEDSKYIGLIGTCVMPKDIIWVSIPYLIK